MMRGSLGEKIGDGAFADVHAWAPGQVVKLFKPGFPRLFSWWEARMTRAVYAAGLPVPEVLDEVTVDGRFGVVLARLDGPTLLQLTRDGAVSFEQAGAILASLALRVHQTPPPRDILSLHTMMVASLRRNGGVVPPAIATGIVALIERLRPGHALCHCDLYTGNVIMAADGPKLIDWTGTLRAPAAYELACTHFVLVELTAPVVDNPQRPLVINAAAQSEYARLTGTSPAALTAAIESYMPIVHVLALLGGAISAHRERLIPRIEAALRSEKLM